MSKELAARESTVPVELQEKVLLGGDLSKLTPQERLFYYNSVCQSVGLNPLTRPFEYIVLNERLVLYARKDCTDQLRELHGISVEIASREVIDGICVVTARAKNMTERTDESIGAVPFMKEEGEWKRSTSGKNFFETTGKLLPLGLEARSNAMMKAETKAKRRVTMSICGLGMIDESEVESITDAKKVRIDVEDTPLPKGAEMLAKLEAKATVQGDGLNQPMKADKQEAEPVDRKPVSQDAPAPPKEQPKPATQATNEQKPNGSQAPLDQSQWQAIITHIDMEPDWATLKLDWKQENKVENVVRLTAGGQQHFLEYMRGKIGSAFPY